MKRIKNVVDERKPLMNFMLFLIFFSLLIIFGNFDYVSNRFSAILLFFLYASSLILILVFNWKKLILVFNRKWLKIDNNGKDLFLAFLLLFTLILFNFSSKILLNYWNSSSSNLGVINTGIFLLTSFSGVITLFGILIALIFLEIKLTKDKKLLRKSLRKIIGLAKNEERK